MSAHLDDEKLLHAVKQMLSQLQAVNASNRIFEAYYEGERRAKSLGISIPPKMAFLRTALGWPATIVDSLEERLDFTGWHSPNDPAGLAQVYAENDLAVESGMVHLDALIHGVGFALVHEGGDSDNTDIVISAQSPKGATGIYNPRTRRLDYGLVRQDDNTLIIFTPKEMITLLSAGDSSAGVYKVADRRVHRFGQVPLVAFPNRRRSGRIWGRSEITRPIRSLTDMAVRTALGAEVSREFYSAPQRWIMGADQTAFTNANGSVATGWEAVLGRVLVLGRDQDGNAPTVGQFSASSPQPYIDQLRALSQLAAAEGAIPAHYLGFVTDNPASADSIRATEARLVKHAERRQVAFGAKWRQVADLIGAVRGKDMGGVLAKWVDASTPTKAATTDAVTKLIAAGALPATSTVTYELLGFAPDQIAQLRLDALAERQTARIQSYAAGLEVSAKNALVREELATSERG